MAIRAIWKGTTGSGLASLPVKMYNSINAEEAGGAE